MKIFSKKLYDQEYDRVLSYLEIDHVRYELKCYLENYQFDEDTLVMAEALETVCKIPCKQISLLIIKSEKFLPSTYSCFVAKLANNYILSRMAEDTTELRIIYYEGV